jgi:hypothetical protein
MSPDERFRYFLLDPPPDRMARIHATVRSWLAFALPRAGDGCR